MFEMLSGLASFMKNSHLVEGRAKELKQRLLDLRVPAESEGGLVKVVATGELKLASITISPVLLNDPQRLEQLLLSTTNQALTEAREKAAKEMASLVDGLGLPGLTQMMSRFGIGMN